MSDPDNNTSAAGKSCQVDHICILVHGLWGNPSHLANFARTIRERHPTERLHILVAKSNSGNHTYDGIEVGGERLAQEIENEIASLETQSHRITKISIVGYSLGGLIARYCIGLLYSRGWFERLQPVTFTAFASPFLGVRSPNEGYFSDAYNAVASRMVSASGHQLFMTDSYRDSGRPLLEVMTDAQSIFVAGLKRFENRAVYANAVNDLSAPWFTSSFTRTDPFADMDAVQLNYMPEHDSVLLDPACPVQRKKIDDASITTRVYNSAASLAGNMPFYALVAVTLPMAATFLTVNCGIQTVNSTRRVQLHKSSQEDNSKSYTVPYLLDSALETIATSEPRAYVSDSETSAASSAKLTETDTVSTSTGVTSLSELMDQKQREAKRVPTASEWPILPLDEQRERMIENLDSIGFRKYPVYISKARQSHAAIIARKNWKNMSEGFVVLQHWLDHEFKI